MWLKRLINALRADRLSDEVERELSFHVRERADELMAGGMSERAAYREARRRFGNYTQQREQTRSVDVFGWLDTTMADLKYASRALRGAPVFALVAILSLGLGIGANTAIFSLLDTVLLKPLPVQRPERLVRVLEEGSDYGVFPNPLWEELRRQQKVFASVMAYGTTRFNLASGGAVDAVEGAWVSGDFFATLGLAPAAGRLIVRDDDRRGCPPVAVLGHDIWRGRYGADRSMVGRTIALNGKDFEVIGVLRKGFTGMEVGTATQIYAPICAVEVVTGNDARLVGRTTWWLRVFGRLQDGLTEQHAAAQLKQLSPAVWGAVVPEKLSGERREAYKKRQFTAAGGATGVSILRMDYSRGLVVLMVVVAMVLLIACANVANLLLARAASRESEIAVRIAIGAGRSRIMRQLITESVLLSFLGALVGIAFASWGNRLLVRLLSTTGQPVWLDLSINGRVLGFALVVAVLTALLFGLAPAWRATRVDPHAVVKASGRVVRGQARFTLGKALVAGQIALSLTLVVGASVLLRTFQKLSTADTGFDPKGVLLATVNLRNTELNGAQRESAFAALVEETRQLPGVTGAATSDLTPLSGSYWNEAIAVDGFTAKDDEDALVWMNEVSDQYFSTLGLMLLEGRDFDPRRDLPSSQKVAVISRSAARKFFGERSAVGRTYRVLNSMREPGDAVLVIGVVEDAKYRTLRHENEPTAYIPSSQLEAANVTRSFEIATDGEPTALIPAFTRAVGNLHPRATIEFMTLQKQLDETLTREKLLATLSGFFGLLAVILATIGLYGVISYNMARRRNEIGVRIALGAARAGILRMVLSEVALITVLGVAVGLVLVFSLGKLVAALLYGVSATQPALLMGAAASLTAAALTAGAIPAIRAARVEPMEALRQE